MKTDKIALVTGSGQGIGRATAVALSAFSHVIIADIDKVSGEETVSIINQKGGSSRFVYLDVSNSDSISQLFLTFLEVMLVAIFPKHRNVSFFFM